LNPGSRIWPLINFSQRDETVPGWFSNFSLWSPGYSFFGPEISSKAAFDGQPLPFSPFASLVFDDYQWFYPPAHLLTINRQPIAVFIDFLIIKL
jgi:hypothetical protein